jgi:hypothetical protein
MLLYLNLGDDSDLHVIIFDEIAAICKVNHLYPLLHVLLYFHLFQALPTHVDELYQNCDLIYHHDP